MIVIIILLLAAAAAWYFIPCGFCRTKSGSGTSMCPTTKDDPVPKNLMDCMAMYKCLVVLLHQWLKQPQQLLLSSTENDMYFKFNSATTSSPVSCSSSVYLVLIQNH